MQIRPDTTDNYILSCLSPKELFNYRATCQYTNKIFKKYMICAFNVETHLATFFTPDEIPVFRMLQAHDGIIISGSFALQFFARIHYPSSDLDLYVEYRHGFNLCTWLVSQGFICKSSSDFTKQYIAGRNGSKLPYNAESYCYNSYGSGSIFTVLTFMRAGKQVQVITTKICVMNIILNYHLSTCKFHMSGQKLTFVYSLCHERDYSQPCLFALSSQHLRTFSSCCHIQAWWS
jgi:hypothetical protein